MAGRIGCVTARFSFETPFMGFWGEKTGGSSMACSRYESWTWTCTNHTPPAGLPGRGVREYHSLRGLQTETGTATESRAGQSRAGQGRAEQGRAGQGRAGQGRAGQGRAGQMREDEDMDDKR